MRVFYDPKTLKLVTGGFQALAAVGDFFTKRREAEAEAGHLKAKAKVEAIASGREQRDLAKEKRIKLARARAMFSGQDADLTGANAISFLAQQRAEFDIRRERLLTDTRIRRSSLLTEAQNVLSIGRAQAKTSLIGGLALAAKTFSGIKPKPTQPYKLSIRRKT